MNYWVTLEDNNTKEHMGVYGVDAVPRVSDKEYISVYSDKYKRMMYFRVKCIEYILGKGGIILYVEEIKNK